MQQAEWVVLALAALATMGNIAIAIIRRNSGARLLAAEKLAKAAMAKAQETATRLDAHESQFGEYRVRIHDMDERISSPELYGKAQLEQRLATIERSSDAEREARDKRREEQHKQELALAVQLTRMGENVKTLAKQVESIHAHNR